MPDEPTPPTLTPGQHCARWLLAAKKECQQNNTVLTWDRVGKIIDATLTGLNAFPNLYPAKDEKPQSEPQKSEVPTVDDVYAAYPRKEGPKVAKKMILRAVQELTLGDKQTDAEAFAYLLDRTQVYAKAVAGWPPDERKQYVPHPSTWFNQGRYADDETYWTRGKPAAAATPRNYSTLG